MDHDAINGNLESVVAQKLFDPERDIEPLLPVEVKEQRLSNLMQSLMVGACVGAMPLIKKIPTAVLSGYFAYMAIESLPGNQFWERLCLLFTSPSQRYKWAFDYAVFHSWFQFFVPTVESLTGFIRSYPSSNGEPAKCNQIELSLIILSNMLDWEGIADRPILILVEFWRRIISNLWRLFLSKLWLPSQCSNWCIYWHALALLGSQ